MSNHILECGNQDEVGFRNTGAKEQCLEGSVYRHAVSVVSQEFATAAEAKELDNWKAARDAKTLFPLFEVDELANANTEDTLKELRQRQIVTANGKKIQTYNAFISLCSHYALKSFHNKKVRLYGFTDKQEILGVSPDGTKVRGQLVTLKVGRRIDALADNPAYTPVTIEYADHNEFEDNGVILRPDWSHIELDGIFDVKIQQVSATASQIKFRVLVGCGAGNEPVTTLASGDVVLKNASGATQSPTFVSADSEGVYTLNGSSFANGFTLSLNGVVSKPEASYEAVAALTISGIS
jgi:hypothetical protein